MDSDISGAKQFTLKDLIEASKYNSQASENNNLLEVRPARHLDRVHRGNRPFIWLLGPPGTGKRTQGAMIKRQLDFTHISVPDLVVAESKSNSPRGEKVSLLLQSKSKFPEDIALTLLKESLSEISIQNNQPPAWLVSGYPRLLSEAYRFEREVGRCALVLYLWANPNLLAERIFKKNSACGAPTPPNLVYYLEKYHVRILSLLQTYSDRLEFIDASKIQEDVLVDILRVLQRFAENIPVTNGITYETQWLNFKQRSDLADGFLAKVPPFLPTNEGPPSIEYMPHWLDLENSTSQIAVTSTKNEKNQSTRKEEISAKKLSSPDKKQKSKKVENIPPSLTSRTVSSQDIRRERRETGKNSLSRKCIRNQNKRTAKFSPVTRNRKSLQKISRKHNDHPRRRIVSPRRDSVSGEKNRKPPKSQSLVSQKRSGDQVFMVNPVIRHSTMAGRVINVINADRRTQTLQASESEIQEKEPKKYVENARSSVRNVEETPRDEMSPTSSEMNQSNPGSLRENAPKIQRCVQLVSSHDIKRMLSEVSGYSRIVVKPSRPKGKGMVSKERSRECGRALNSSRKNSRSNSPSHMHGKDSRCDMKRNASKHSNLSQSINLIESTKNSSTRGSGSESTVISFDGSIISVPSNQSQTIDQQENKTNTCDESVERLQRCDLPLNPPHKSDRRHEQVYEEQPHETGLPLDQPHKNEQLHDGERPLKSNHQLSQPHREQLPLVQSHKRINPPGQTNTNIPHKSNQPVVSLIKSGSKLELNCPKTAISTNIPIQKSSVSIKDHGVSNIPETNQVRKCTSNIKSKDGTDDSGTIISVKTFSGNECVGNASTSKHIIKTAEVPKFIQIKKSVSQNQKLNPLNIQVVLNKPKTKDTPVLVTKQKSLLTSSGEVSQKCNSDETKTRSECILTRSGGKEKTNSVVDYTPRVILNPKVLSSSTEHSITSESKVNFLTKPELKNSDNKMKKDSHLDSEVIYDSNSEVENEIFAERRFRTPIHESPELSSSYETKSSIGSGDVIISKNVSTTSSQSCAEDKSLRDPQKNVSCILNRPDNKIHLQKPQTNDEAMVYATNNKKHGTNLINSQVLENNSSYTILKESNTGKKSLTKISASISDKKMIKCTKQISSISNNVIDLNSTKNRNSAAIANMSNKEKHGPPRDIAQSFTKPKTLDAKNTVLNNKIAVNDKSNEVSDSVTLLRSKSSGKMSSRKKTTSEADTDKTSTSKQFSHVVVLHDKILKSENDERALTKPDVENNKCEEKKSNLEAQKKKSENSSGKTEFVEEKNIQSQNCLKVSEKVKDSEFIRGVHSKLFYEISKTKDSMSPKKVRKDAYKIIDVSSSAEKYISKSDTSNNVKKSETFEESNIFAPKSVKDFEKSELVSQSNTERKSVKKTTISEKCNDISKPGRTKVSSKENVLDTSLAKIRRNLREMSDVESFSEKISLQSTSSRKIEMASTLEKSESVGERSIQSHKKVKSIENVESSSPNVERYHAKSVEKVTSKKKITFIDENDLKNDAKSKENLRFASPKAIKTTSKDLETHSSKQNISSYVESSKRVSSAVTIKQYQSSEQENIKAKNIKMSEKDISATKSKSVGRLSPKTKNSEKMSKNRSDSNSRTNSSAELHGDMPRSKKNIQNVPKVNDENSVSEKNLHSKKVKSVTKVQNSDSSEVKKIEPLQTIQVSIKFTTSGTDTTPSVSKSLGKISTNKKSVHKGEINKKTENSKSLSKTNVLPNVSSTKSSQSSSKMQDVQVRTDKSSPKFKKNDTTTRDRISESPKEKNLPQKPSAKTTLKKKVVSETHGSTKKMASSKLLTKGELLNESSNRMGQNPMKDEWNPKTEQSIDRILTKDLSKTKTSTMSTPQNRDVVRKGESSKVQASIKVSQVNKCLSPRKIKSNMSGLSTGESAGKTGTLTRETQLVRTGSARNVKSNITKMSCSQKDISNPPVSLPNSLQPRPTGMDKPLTKYPCNVESKSNKNLQPVMYVQYSTNSELFMKDDSSRSDIDSDVSNSRPEISLYYKMCSSIQQPTNDEVQPPTFQKRPLRGRKMKCKPQWVSELPDVDETAESRQPTRENSLKQISSIRSVSSSKSCSDRKNQISAKTRCGLNTLSLASDQAASCGSAILTQVSNTSKTILQPLQTRSNLFHDSAYDSPTPSSAGTQRHPSPRYSSPRPRRPCQKAWMPYGSATSLSICGSPGRQESPTTSEVSVHRRSSTSIVFFI